MHLRRSLLSALVVASTIGFGVAPAYAGATGSGTITFEGQSCDFTFTYAGGPPPAAVEIQSIDIADGCAADGTASGTVTFGPDDAATLTLNVAVSKPLSCGYSGSLTGTYAGNAATFPEQDVPKESGSILCPNPASIAVQATL
ncbi:hypothetical protein [Kribbella speibonae]|uniref:Uncharacterized protein n=1 Tax=Kribbella speibonae TaxID=1572660 RepID=A0A4R0IFU3_9ACTN|nr:hypothetical protein [Kribbella speibonae]TCC24671.1 hypothetical protein E0H58_10635 [Kribbella speibonae]TCC30914.1 hypothetical protein E0H92_38085 [Kribbella speibonae]